MSVNVNTQYVNKCEQMLKVKPQHGKQGMYILCIVPYVQYMWVRQYSMYSAYECKVPTVMSQFPSFSRLVYPSSKEVLCRNFEGYTKLVYGRYVRFHSLKT